MSEEVMVDDAPSENGRARRPRERNHQVTDIDVAFQHGSLERLPSAVLRSHLLSLANQSPKGGQRDLVRSMVLTNLLLLRRVERLNRRISFQYWVVAAIAAAALLSSVIEIVVTLTREPVRIELPRIPTQTPE